MCTIALPFPLNTSNYFISFLLQTPQLSFVLFPSFLKMCKRFPLHVNCCVCSCDEMVKFEWSAAMLHLPDHLVVALLVNHSECFVGRITWIETVCLIAHAKDVYSSLIPVSKFKWFWRVVVRITWWRFWVCFAWSLGFFEVLLVVDLALKCVRVLR